MTDITRSAPRRQSVRGQAAALVTVAYQFVAICYFSTDNGLYGDCSNDFDWSGLVHANEVSEATIGAAIEVHRQLGPGLLESGYESCMCYELQRRGLAFQRQLTLPVRHKDIVVENAYRADLVVEGLVVVELKSVDLIHRVHISQLLTYLKMSGHSVGLLINFNVPVLVQGVKRVVHNFKG